MVASTSRSRLPRPSQASSLIANVKSSSTTVPFDLPASTSSASNTNNAGTAKKKDELNAFAHLMAKAKEKAEKEKRGKIFHQRLNASTSSRPEKQKLTAKERMRGRQKEKPQKTTSFIPDEEEEDSHTESELTAPTEDPNRFVASSKSPEPYNLAQEVKSSTSEDIVLASSSEIGVETRDTIMSEHERLTPFIEVTAVFPSEKVAEMVPLQLPPAPLLLEDSASSTNEFMTSVPSEFESLRPNVGPSRLPRGKRRQPTSAPVVDRVTRSVSLKQKQKADSNIQPGMFQPY